MSLAAVAGLGQAARVMSRAPSPLPAGRAAVLTGAVTWCLQVDDRFEMLRDDQLEDIVLTEVHLTRT